MVDDLAPAIIARQQRSNGRALLVTVLYRRARPRSGAAVSAVTDHGRQHGESVRAREERVGRVVAHLRIDVLAGRHVRRIGQHRVDPAGQLRAASLASPDVR